MKKLIIYDNEGKPATEYTVPRLVDESDVNKWAARLFAGFRKKASDKRKVDHWTISNDKAKKNGKDNQHP